jgi:hypothetical protein
MVARERWKQIDHGSTSPQGTMPLSLGDSA